MSAKRVRAYCGSEAERAAIRLGLVREGNMKCTVDVSRLGVGMVFLLSKMMPSFL